MPETQEFFFEFRSRAAEKTMGYKGQYQKYIFE